MIRNIKNNSTRVVGNSMYPLIRSGDEVYYQKNTERLQLGDIIIFYENDKLVIHRIIKFKDKTIRTKGDNSMFIDRKVSRNRVLGKAIKIKSNDGELNLESLASQLLKYFFLLDSLIPYGIVKIIYKFSSRLLFLRVIFRKLLVN